MLLEPSADEYAAAVGVVVLAQLTDLVRCWSTLHNTLMVWAAIRPAQAVRRMLVCTHL